MIEAIKNDLPNMPDEVIEVWLETHYNRFGWPPPTNPEWRYVLNHGRPRNLEYLQRMSWTRQDLSITPTEFAPKAMEVIEGLINYSRQSREVECGPLKAV